MSEQLPRRNYSPAAQRVTEAFTSSPEELAKFVERDLIATNNLGYKMWAYQEGPDSDHGKLMYNTLLSPRDRELLETARTQDPELWEQTVSSYISQSDLSTRYFDTMQTYGYNSPEASATASQLRETQWQDTELRTRVFDLIDQQQITTDEAMDLCR